MKIGCREAPDFFVCILLCFCLLFVCLLYLLFSIVDRVLIVFIVFVIVLSLTFSATAVFYSASRAVVIACETRQAFAVVFPYGCFSILAFNVACGAYLCALAAMYASVRVDTKLAVAYNPIDKGVT